MKNLVLERLLPARLDNDVRGHRAAIWCLVPLVVLRAPRGAAGGLQGART
jgi:hypothetical protein